MTIPPLPSRSRLYCLEPAGIGTPYVESLTSYITRLAATHHISPTTLIKREILPLHDQGAIDPNHPTRNYRLDKFWNCNAETLNSMSPIARQWVQTLQTLTSYNYLQYLTMLPWNEVLAARRLLRESKAWCPDCYIEWYERGQVVYEPLIWALRDVDICSNHKKDLTILCPHCQRTQPFLTQFSRSGYCPYCVRWLGVVNRPRNVDQILNSDEKFRWQCWVGESIGTLLSAAPNLPILPIKNLIAVNMTTLLDHYVGGNAKSLAKLLKMSPQQILNYIQGSCVPYLCSLLKICFSFSISPLDFLAGTTFPLQDIPRFALEQIPTVSCGKRKKVTEADIQHMRQVFKTILSIDSQTKSYPCLKEITQLMGYKGDTVRRHCPDLYQKCKERYKQQCLEESTLVKFQQALEEVLSSEDRLSLISIGQELGCSVSVLRYHFPDLCKAVARRYRERFDYELMEKHLRSALAGCGMTPTIGEIARELGYKRHNLWGKFPDLCKQIAERCRMEQNERHKERVTKFCSEIRCAVLTLHQQGIYPSTRRISKIISYPYAVRSKEGYETWIMMLEELGYSTEKLKKH